MRAHVRQQRGTGLWLCTGVSAVTGEAVTYGLFATWREAMDWATGAAPRRRQPSRLATLLSLRRPT